MSDLSIAAVKRHALACSKKTRNGRFTRVGQDFLNELEGEVEQIIRELRNKAVTTVDPLPVEENFLTPALSDKLRCAVNELIARHIQNKIQRQPSIGCTAGRTY